jgi:hypothetical protein
MSHQISELENRIVALMGAALEPAILDNNELLSLLQEQKVAANSARFNCDLSLLLFFLHLVDPLHSALRLNLVSNFFVIFYLFLSSHPCSDKINVKFI